MNKLPIGQIICGDCRKVMKGWDLKDVVLITDPPYPDQHPEYGKVDIRFLEKLDCRQIIFWSAKVKFPLNFTAIHIWDKVIDCASYYERIFERNGQRRYMMYRCHPVNSCQSAQGLRDIWTGHKSQKPRRLIKKLILDFSKPDDIIFDPFCGSGTILEVAGMLSRRWVGIEVNEKWCKVARKRTEVVRKNPGFRIFK